MPGRAPRNQDTAQRGRQGAMMPAWGEKRRNAVANCVYHEPPCWLMESCSNEARATIALDAVTQNAPCCVTADNPQWAARSTDA